MGCKYFLVDVLLKDMYLCTRVGPAKQVTDCSSSNSSSSSRITTLYCRDGLNRDLLLPEASLGVGDERCDKKSLGDHDVVCGRVGC